MMVAMGRRGAGTRGASGGGPQAPSGNDRQAPPGADRPGRGRQPQNKPGRGATYSVVVMTLACLAAVGVLAVQAAATAPKVSNNAGRNASGSPRPNPGSSNTASAAPDPNALPANSGSGTRIVYGEGARRVWLVSSSNAVLRTIVAVPGTIPAPAGTYSVTNLQSSATGTDGKPVQYVVLFDKMRYNGSSTALGFDAVANVTGLPPAPTSPTGGVRMAQADAQALWSFSKLGTKVVVVP
jgi:hypothetical protein